MKAERFRESLDHINDKYIEEAAQYGPGQSFQGSAPQKNVKPFRAVKVWRAVAIAACALLAVGVGFTAIGLLSDGSKSSHSDAAKAPIYDGEYYNDAGDSFSTGEYSNSFEDSDALTEDFAVPEAPAESFDSASGAGSFEAETAGETKSDGITTMLPQDENAKIIYSAYIDMDTTEFDDAQAQIEAITKNHNGYFENLDQDSYSDYRNAYYLIRVPADEFDAFMKEAQEIGTVTSISQNAADVSENYYDIESRLETAKTKLARLQELLSKAENMSDIITIENEIADVQWEIDDLSGSLKRYDSEIEYSTVTLNLHEVYRITDGDAPLTFGERISSAFSKGIKAFTGGMEDFLVFLAASWLWILLVAIVAAVVIIILAKCLKKDKKTGNIK